MKCDGCGEEKENTVRTEREGKPVRLCPTCSERMDDTPACRCKETVGKSPSEVLKMVVQDMFGRKK